VVKCLKCLYETLSEFLETVQSLQCSGFLLQADVMSVNVCVCILSPHAASVITVVKPSNFYFLPHDLTGTLLEIQDANCQHQWDAGTTVG
jgi:hypothetical protein